MSLSPGGVASSVRVAAALLVLLSGAGAQRGAPQAAPGLERGEVQHDLDPAPNVLVLLGDDFGWTDFETVPTPNLDALAHRGMTFRRAYAYPICSPTRYALLFGRYPRRDGIGGTVSQLPPGPDNPTPPLGLVSLAESLRLTPHGRYQTGIFGKWHLGVNELYDDAAPDIGPFNFGALTPRWQGFDRWFGSMANLRDYENWTSVSDGVFAPSREYEPRAILREFQRFWSSRQGPKFAYMAFHNAHADYHVPPADMLPPGYPTPVTTREQFEAMIASMDWMVGEMLAGVDLENTYVFFLPDNGSPRGVSIEDCPPRPWEPFQPFECAKHTVFEPGIRLPLIVSGPDVVPGSTTDALVSVVDLMATIDELVGVPPRGDDSISFRPTLLDPSASPRRVVFSEIFGEYELFIGGEAHKEESAAIGDRYKLRRINGVETLYDLATDPREAVRLPLADPAYAAILADLRAVLDDPLERARQVR